MEVAWVTYEDIDTVNSLVLQLLHAKTDQLLLMMKHGQLDGGRTGDLMSHQPRSALAVAASRS